MALGYLVAWAIIVLAATYVAFQFEVDRSILAAILAAEGVMTGALGFSAGRAAGRHAALAELWRRHAVRASLLYLLALLAVLGFLSGGHTSGVMLLAAVPSISLVLGDALAVRSARRQTLSA